MDNYSLLPSRPGREIAVHHCEQTICTKEEQVTESVLLPSSSTSAGFRRVVTQEKSFRA